MKRYEEGIWGGGREEEGKIEKKIDYGRGDGEGRRSEEGVEGAEASVSGLGLFGDCGMHACTRTMHLCVRYYFCNYRY